MRSSRPYFWLLAALILGWSLAAYAERDQLSEDNPTNHRGIGFSVATDGDRAVLVEGNSGQTWLLTPSASSDESPVWIPLRRIDDPEEARLWRNQSSTENPRNDLGLLKTELQLMQKRYPPTHSKIIELRKKIVQLQLASLELQHATQQEQSREMSYVEAKKALADLNLMHLQLVEQIKQQQQQLKDLAE